MGAVTYPDITTATLMNEYFVPVQVDVSKSASLVERFGVVWTPNISILTGDEKMVYHVEGWLPPHDFTAMLTLACGHYYLKNENFKDAASFFEEVRKKMPNSQFASEALYYLGVARYLKGHEVEKLKEEWARLQKFYPESTWAISSDVL